MNPIIAERIICLVLKISKSFGLFLPISARRLAVVARSRDFAIRVDSCDFGVPPKFIQIAPGRYEFVAATQSITDLKVMFGRPAHPVSIDDMNKAIAKRGATAR
jgi:hypothetical protein